jgi:hypothetical protein
MAKITPVPYSTKKMYFYYHNYKIANFSYDFCEGCSTVPDPLQGKNILPTPVSPV